MLEHFSTETDQVFDQLIYNEQHPNVPQGQYFLHSTTARTQPRSTLVKKDEAQNNDRIFTSPFRSTLTPDQLDWSQEIKYQKYSHLIEYPEFLTQLETIQNEELNELRAKEGKLAYYKASQNIIKYDKDKYKYIETPIDLNTVPRVPYFTYKTLKSKKQLNKNTLNVSRQMAMRQGDNPWATPKNKEDIIIYKGKFYSKPNFDNIQLQQLSHDRFIANQWKNCKDRKEQLQKEYNTKFKDIDTQINQNKTKMTEMEQDWQKVNEYYDNNLTKQYLEDVETFNKAKTNKLNSISKLKKIISESESSNDQGRDRHPDHHDTTTTTTTTGPNEQESFEYETTEEIKYI